MADQNPMTQDAKLKELLKDVGSIKSEDAFKDWRTSFLKVYAQYLDPDGVANARDADGRLLAKLTSLANVTANKVQPLIDDGNISKEQVTAEGWTTIGKLTEEMSATEKALGQFCPKTSKDEDAVGYDKFELGAVLIKDGFHAYEIMVTTRDVIKEMRDGPLDGVLERNHLSIMDFYFREIQSFIDVMADLGLMKLMKACVSIYKKKPRPPPKLPGPDGKVEEDESDHEIFVNCGGKHPDGPNSMGEGGPDSFTQGPNSSTAASAKRRSKEDDSDSSSSGDDEGDDNPEDPPPDDGDGGGDSDKLYFFDPLTGAIGVISRSDTMEKSDLIAGKDDKGVEHNNGVVTEEGEKQELVWLLKKLEKKKPKEGAWLEEIKKAKAAKKAAEAAAASGGKNGTAKPTRKSSTGKPTKKTSTGSASGATKPTKKSSDASANGAKPRNSNSGFKTLADMTGGDASSDKPKTPKSPRAKLAVKKPSLEGMKSKSSKEPLTSTDDFVKKTPVRTFSDKGPQPAVSRLRAVEETPEKHAPKNNSEPVRKPVQRSKSAKASAPTDPSGEKVRKAPGRTVSEKHPPRTRPTPSGDAKPVKVKSTPGGFSNPLASMPEKRPSRQSTSSSGGAKPEKSKDTAPTGFKNPLAGGGSPSAPSSPKKSSLPKRGSTVSKTGSSSTKEKTPLPKRGSGAAAAPKKGVGVKDYQGKYKTVAAKPDSSGWAKVGSAEPTKKATK